ncbi:MAG TPA: protein-glutamate O-methyltransferase CheR [Geobacteraceae bacterium]
MVPLQSSPKPGDRSVRLSDGDFRRLSRFIQETCGIKISDSKKTMLETRLLKRVKSLGLGSFADYCAYLFDAGDDRGEVVRMIDLVTTNKTDFFREPDHFAYLLQHVLPAWVQLQPDHGGRKFHVWSAGCSTGEEAYTLAMVLNEFAEGNTGFDFQVLASDISVRALEAARLAVYAEERAEPVPIHLKRKYFLRSKDRSARQVRVIPALRRKVHFARLNFMADDFGMVEKFDAIFCRNVIIYFDKGTQERLLQKLCCQLSPHGYVFLGHSETLGGLDVRLSMVYPTVYRKLP